MNWFTDVLFNPALSSHRDAIDTHGACEHVESDPSLAHRVVSERDSWGAEHYVYCADCYREMRERENNRTVTCPDCKQRVPVRETISWKWYDFYAPQGDTPLVICQACSQAPKHRQRVRDDEADRLFELGE